MIFKNIKLIDKDFNVKKDMYVRTEGAFITYVGDKAPENASGENIYDGNNKLLMPSFYNTHCHVPMTYLRGYGEGLPLQRWLNEKIFPFEDKLDGEAVYWSTKLGALELIASGSASISDMYFFIGDMARALDECGMKANICHGISSFDPEQKLSELKGYKDTVELDILIKSGAFGGEKGTGKGSRIMVDMGLHAEYTSTEGLVRQVAEAAGELGIGVHTHISETVSEHAECKKRHNGMTPVKYFDECGLFNNVVKAAHCVYIEPEDIDIMKAAGAYAIHNPSSNLKLGSGIAPVKTFMEKGLNVGIGTDGASSNNNLNMMEEIHMAAMIARGSTLDANAVSDAAMLKAAALTGALSQGRGDCGRIEEGCRADLIVIDLDRPHLRPDYDTRANVVFSAQSSDIVLNMIDGKVVYKNGEYLTIDKEKVIAETEAHFDKILAQL
ncbi:MAG: amidohydrolase [Lachnospiraceae bacterium]|nr:amidohydrolase [Lachnospiraceae bacterium]